MEYILIIGFSWKEQEGKVPANVFEEIRTENFPNLRKNIDIQMQEAQNIPNRMNPKKST